MWARSVKVLLAVSVVDELVATVIQLAGLRSVEAVAAVNGELAITVNVIPLDSSILR
jgi:hypothetical protein